MLSLISLLITLPIMLILIALLVMVLDLQDIVVAALFHSPLKLDFLGRFSPSGRRTLRTLSEEEILFSNGYALSLKCQRGPSASLADATALPIGSERWVVSLADAGTGEPTQWGMAAEPGGDPPMKLLMVCDEQTGNPLLRRFIGLERDAESEATAGDAKGDGSWEGCHVPPVADVMAALYDVTVKGQARPAGVVLAQPSVTSATRMKEMYQPAIDLWLGEERARLAAEGELEDFCGRVGERLWDMQRQKHAEDVALEAKAKDE